MPKPQPQLDETALSYADLIKVVPDAAVAEIAANLVKDQGMYMDTLQQPSTHTHGTTMLYDRDESPMISIKLTPENARSIIIDDISEGIDGDMMEKIEELGLPQNEVAMKIGNIIFGETGLKGVDEFSYQLSDSLGYNAWSDNGEDDMVENDGGEGEWMLDNIANRITETRDEIETPQPIPQQEELKKQNELRKQYFYLAGVGKHLKNLLERSPISVAQYRRIIDYYNDATKGTGLEDAYISWDSDWRPDYDYDVVKNIFNWMVNPLSYLKDNPGIKVNLLEYEKEHGKIPRQYDLPGFRYKTKTHKGG